jgi:ADP-ribose pyrophosphatase
MLKKWQLISEEDISPSPYFPLYKHQVKLPNGKTIPDFYISKLGDVATILAITTDYKILLVRQYKHGLGDITIELPAGRIPQGENPLVTAKRELLEETGFMAKKYLELGGVCPIPSKDGSIAYGFIALNLTNTHKQHLDITEDIEVLQLSNTEIDEFIKEGKIIGSDAIATITLARIKHPELFVN